MSISDSELVEQTTKGDKEAFGILYERHLDEIYRYVYFRVFNHQEAEDLTETVFLKAWEALPKSRRVKNFRAWIYRIAHNLVIDYRKKKSPEILEAEPPVREDLIGIGPALEEKQESQRLMQALARLEFKYRQVIVLRFFNQMSHAEVARVLDVEEGHVRVLQCRGLQKLGLIMNEGWIDEG